jgi:hypothetical protein
MIDLGPLIHEELVRRVPRIDFEPAPWQDVLRRAGELSRRRQRRIAFAVVVAVTLGALATGPLGGAVIRAAGGFSAWLSGTPGTPAGRDAQEMFETANNRSLSPFPGNPQLHELLHVTLDGRRFSLYGFETRQVVCLRVAVRAPEGAGPQAACVARADLRRSGDLVLPVKANLSVGQLGRVQTAPSQGQTVPKYLLTFGIAAAGVTRVTVESDGGASAAVVRNRAFLHVFKPGRRGNWARKIVARVAAGRRTVVPISVQVSGQPSLRTRLRPRGPAVVERTVRNGTIGWFVRREPRGLSVDEAHVSLPRCCPSFVRVLEPDPQDFLRLLVSDRTIIEMPFKAPKPNVGPGEHQICLGIVTHGSAAANCRTIEQLFRDRPWDLSWGFSGAGQQIWMVEGLVSDDVARIEVFLGTGVHWQAPLRDNATFFRVPRAKFPARIVAYDRDGRVIAVQTIRGG